MENNEGNVREMTRTEKNFYNGVTIDADSFDGRSSEKNFHNYRRTTYVNVSNSNIFTGLIGSFVRAVFNGNKLARIGAILIGMAFAALMFFVALPIIFVLLAVGIVFFALSKISR